MKKKTFVILNIFMLSGIFISLLTGCTRKDASQQPSTASGGPEIESMISEMTLEEKVGQMTQITLEELLKRDSEGALIEPVQLDPDRLKKAIVEYKVGSILNCGGHARSLEKWNEIISQIQEMALEETRMKIPVIYGIDAIHGANYTKNATLFPQQIAQAAAWSPEMTERVGSITAYETRASGIPWNFSPVLGLGREPAWPRFWETFGEDVYLAKTLGNAMIKGYQGDQLTSDSTKVAACMKHYMGYSVPNTGKDRTPASIPERELRQYFLPPFAGAVKSGVQTVMVNSGEINGTPAHASEFLLKDLLREELNFDGFVVSDWMDIRYLHTRHKVAATQKEAVKMAINAGIDMSMVPDNYNFCTYLIQLVKEGKVSEKRIDEAVSDILMVKKQLGLFEKPVTKPSSYPRFASEEFSQFNLEVAEEVITLLKNRNNTLPIQKNDKVLVTGPTANSMAAMNGGWSYTWQGTETDSYIEANNTILEAVQQKVGQDKVVYAAGSGFEEEKNVDLAVSKASSIDHIILCLGENAYCETPGNIKDLYLPEPQTKLAQKLAETGKPITLVLVEGRPRLISKFEQQMDAVLMSYLPGNRGGDAIANVLYGEVNPSGKLPFTYPKYPNSLETYDRKHTENLGVGGTSPTYDPQYEFGHGLSYTEFEYGNLELSDTVLTDDAPLEVSVSIRNTGDRDGEEVALMFLSDHYATITPPVKRLKGFEKIALEPGQSEKITFRIQSEDLAFVNKNNQWIKEKGRFTVRIGGKSAEFVYK
jgi:beta-glucosidase